MNRQSLTLLLAVGLGVLAAVFNLLYVREKTRGGDVVEFLGIAPDVTLAVGDAFSEKHFTRAPVPRLYASDLVDFAVLYQDRQAVVGLPATRRYGGGEIVLRQDLRTPPSEVKLADDERAMWVPVDPRSFVPSLVTPGDLVSFLAPRALMPIVQADSKNSSDSSAMEIVGPFRIISVGNRLGSADVLGAARIPQVQENVVTIAVTLEHDQLEPRAQKLWSLLRANDGRQLGLLLHPRKKRDR